MLDKYFLNNISRLFNEKNYNEVILKIEQNIKINDRPPDLTNLCAVSKLLKANRSKDDVISALNDFEVYYQKSYKNFQKIEAVSNFIVTCITNVQEFKEIIPYFKKAQKLYEDCEEKIGYDKKLYSHGADLYKYTLNHYKNRKILNELINNKTDNKNVACTYGYMSNYTYDWGIKEYFDYSKKFEHYFPKHKVKNINEINYKENKKIRIGFV